MVYYIVLYFLRTFMESEKKTEKQSNFRLIWSFLKGSKALFAVCIISAALMALADMVIPQIIRAAIDNAIGGAPADYPGDGNAAG